eukprot:m.78331 g.78331  ORF g.78331 m.78331 type:complete len:177 (-) comp10692_c0_seq2:134-664(-)
MDAPASESKPLVGTGPLEERRARRARNCRLCLAKGQYLFPFVIAKIVMGAMFLDKCSGEPRVPRWLLASGIIQLPLIFLMFGLEERMVAIQEKYYLPPWLGLELLLDIVGASIVFSHATPPDDCNLAVWQFAGLFIFSVFCFLFMSVAMVMHRLFCPDTKCFVVGPVVIVSSPRTY